MLFQCFLNNINKQKFQLTLISSIMQFKTIVAAFATVAAVQAQAANVSTNGSNGTNGSNTTSTNISTGAAASNALGAGVFGAAVAAGVAFLF